MKKIHSKSTSPTLLSPLQWSVPAPYIHHRFFGFLHSEREVIKIHSPPLSKNRGGGILNYACWCCKFPVCINLLISLCFKICWYSFYHWVVLPSASLIKSTFSITLLWSDYISFTPITFFLLLLFSSIHNVCSNSVSCLTCVVTVFIVTLWLLLFFLHYLMSYHSSIWSNTLLLLFLLPSVYEFLLSAAS